MVSTNPRNSQIVCTKICDGIRQVCGSNSIEELGSEEEHYFRNASSLTPAKKSSEQANLIATKNSLPPTYGGTTPETNEIVTNICSCHNFFSLSSVQIIFIPACCLLCVL